MKIDLRTILISVIAIAFSIFLLMLDPGFIILILCCLPGAILSWRFGVHEETNEDIRER